MSPSLRSASFNTARKSKEQATLKLKHILSTKSCFESISTSVNKRRKTTIQGISKKPKMGQKFSSYVRRGPNGIKTKSVDDSEQKATNIDEVPHPSETLGLRIKLFGPTNIILVIRTNTSNEELPANTSPNHSPASSIYCRIHAHREVLCMRSKYFYSMLQGPYKSKFRNSYAMYEYSSEDLELCGKNDEEINLVSIYRKTPCEMADMLGQILHFLYFDQRALNPDNVQTLLEAANYYQVEDLQHQCCRYIKDRIDRKNVIEIYLMALVYGTYELQRAAETFVMEHYESITSNKMTMKMFVQFLSKDELVKFISSDKLIVSSEGVVYKSILKWIQHEPATRARHLPQLLTHVDLPSILRDEVEDCHRISLQVKRNKNYLCIPPASTLSLEDSLNISSSVKRKTTLDSTNTPPQTIDTPTCDKISSTQSEPSHDHVRYNSVSEALENVMNEAKDYLRMDTNTKIDYWTKPGRSKPARWPKVLVVMRMYWKNLPMEWYDFRTRTWETLSDVQNWRSCTAMVGHRSTIFLLGGEESDPNSPTGSRTVNRVTKYDCEHKQWSTGPSMLLARRWAGAIVVDDSIYVIGGIGGKGGTYEKRLDSMEKLKISSLGENPTKNALAASSALGNKNEKSSHKWVNLAPMSTSRSSHTVEYMNGKIYVVGGGDGKEWLCSAECYDIKSNKWSPIANLNAKRWKCGLVEVGDMLYAIGGMDSPRAGCWGSPLKTVERYSPTENKWVEVASMNEPRFGCSVVAYQGKIYASGGFGVSKSILQTMECYDPSTNKWTKMPQMKKMCGFVGGTLIDRPIHLDTSDSRIASSLRIANLN